MIKWDQGYHNSIIILIRRQVMNSAVPVVTPQEAGENLWFGGGLVTFKVTSEQSGGVLCLIEHAASRGKRTPLHLHPDSDETVYVLEGELLLHIDGIEYMAGPGAVAWIPRGVPHAFLVTSELERSLWAVTPGGAMEAFYRQAGDPASSRTLPPAEIDITRLRAAGEETGAMKTLGPPPFPTDRLA
jgi:quercetin dioxygenase-like cupin family protein